MYNSYLVILTSDTDCDGTSYGAHRIAVPTARRMEFLSSVRATVKHAIESEQIRGMADAYAVMDIVAFWREFGPNMDAWDREYFTLEGYTNSHIAPHWNSWVDDDSIGIPALDHTNDPPLYTDDDIEMMNYHA